MLEVRDARNAALPKPDASVDLASFTPDIMRYLAVIRRDWTLIAASVVLFSLLAIAYVLTTTPRYTASALIMIDTRKNQVLQNQVIGDQQLDASGIESQVEVLKSESVAMSVIRDLKLADDPELMGGGSLISAILSPILGSGPSSETEKDRRAVDVFGRSLSVKRLGLTYVIQIDFTSFSAQKSADIANAIADAYMVNELDARYQATKRASRWLQDRIKELREQANAADQKVQEFRAENKIVDTGRGLLSEQQLADVNTQLATARAATAEAKAKLDRVLEVASGDIPDASVTDALKSDVITRLRAQYLDLSARLADWSARYGSSHAAAVNLRNQMGEIRRSVLDEIKRIAATYKSDYEIARAREESLQASLAGLVNQAGVNGQAQVKLRDLESSAQSARNLYDSFLQRFMEATQQQTFPVGEARLITAATAPLRKSWPKGFLILSGAGGLGLMLGIGAALARDRFRNVFRTASEIESYLGVPCLGVIPKVQPLAPVPDVPGSHPSTAPRMIAPVSPVYQHVLAAPFSRFTETLRSIKVAVDIAGLTRETRVIGVGSALPNEGKSTVAANTATLIAQTGNRVLLIDGDLRNPSLTGSLAPHAEEGLIEVLSGERTVDEVICVDPKTGLHLLPAVVKSRLSHTADLLSSRSMAKLLEAARERYHYVILDLPPVVPVVDVRAAGHLIDWFVFVTEWAVTNRTIVAEALDSVDVMRDRLIGVVLNKGNPAVLKRIESYKGRHYQSYYREYGSTME